MNNQEFQDIPEVQEQIAATKLARMYQNSSSGDVDKNTKAISASVVVKYQESMSTDRGIDQMLVYDAQRAAKATRNRYSGIPKLLIDGVKHEGQEYKPSETWLSNQAQKMKTFSEAMELVDSVPNADVLNLIIDTIMQVDIIKSESGESVKSFAKTAEAIKGNELTLTDLQEVVHEIESLMSQKKADMMKTELSMDEDNRQGSKNIDVTIAYMVARCIDYAIETYPVRILKNWSQDYNQIWASKF